MTREELGARAQTCYDVATETNEHFANDAPEAAIARIQALENALLDAAEALSEAMGLPLQRKRGGRSRKEGRA